MSGVAMQGHENVQAHRRDALVVAAHAGSRTVRPSPGRAGRSVLGLLGLTMVLLLLSALVIAVLVLALDWLVFGIAPGGLGA
jgi:hypothetical protein